ncbi:MAG: S-layer homology domain-containing protein [Actinobacteria bacterium]|nr:S-layer homology domain-containing protein [Actinomycetota bacterium]
MASWPSNPSSGPGTLPRGWPSYTFWQWTDSTIQPSPTGTQTVDGDVLSTSLSLSSVATTVTRPTSFADVPSSYPFSTEITWLASAGISTGWATPQGRNFQPQTPIARDAMAAFLYRFAGSPAYTPPTTSPFSDVPTSYPFYTQIAWLAATGITTGYGDGTFHPGDPVNRDAMAAFLYRFAGSPAYTPPTTPRFSDVPTSYPFSTQIAWLAATGITTGYGDGTFQPGSAVNRDAMAAFLYRYHQDGLPTSPVVH